MSLQPVPTNGAWAVEGAEIQETSHEDAGSILYVMVIRYITRYNQYHKICICLYSLDIFFVAKLCSMAPISPRFFTGPKVAKRPKALA